MQKNPLFFSRITDKAERCLSSHVEALVPGLCGPSVPRIHIDIGGYKIIQLVTL